MLNQEEKMIEILSRVHQEDGSFISIPSFLPPRMKELLAELAMVQVEIERLENQLSLLQLGLKQEQEATNETISKRWQSTGSVMTNIQSLLSSTSIQNPIKLGGQVKMPFENKALYFINKAIKGDYTLGEFMSVKERTGKSKPVLSDQKEHYQYQEEVKFQERIPRKSGLSMKGRLMPESNWDIPPKSLSRTLVSEQNSQSWHPNKLSEDIIKCLNFIFVRLLRTSRAMELDNSGPITRCMNTPLSSRSFRAENPMNPKSALALHKEPRQQDPYGVFDMDESIPRDIGPYKNLVIFTSNSMDPKCISCSSSIALLKKLRVLMSNLQKVDLRALTYQQKLAFWINMYNACVMHGYLQYGVPNTPEKVMALMNKATLNVGGNKISAQAMEHYIMGKLASSNINKAHQKCDREDKEIIIRKLYGLKLMEPNIIFALCCGTRSSPAVRIYTAEGVAAELEKSKLEYLQASIVVTNTKKIALPELLIRNMFDFSMDINSLVQWIIQQLPTSGSLRKSMVDCFSSHNSGNISITVDKIPYDFEFQYLLAM